MNGVHRYRSSTVIAFVFALIVPAASADMQRDLLLQHGDDAYRRSVVDETFRSKISDLLNDGYPPASVFLHAVSMGAPLADVVEVSVHNDVAQAQYYYDVAVSMLPTLPGWACRAGNHAPGGITDSQQFDESSDQTIGEIAQAFFSGKVNPALIPDWQSGGHHTKVTVADLETYVDSTQRATGSNEDRWYQSNTSQVVSSDTSPQTSPQTSQKGTTTTRPAFISLYKKGEQIITDVSAARIAAAKAAGISHIPAVFLFNQDYVQPVSHFGDSTNIRNIAGEFFAQGTEVTAVPEWKEGDFHINAQISEMLEIFEVPEQSSVDEQRWQTLEREIAQGTSPMKITLLQEGERLWLDEPEKLAVAKSMGQNSLPVVFYYHGMNRLPCGADATMCIEHVCAGAIAGGADTSVCQRFSDDTKTQVGQPLSGIGSNNIITTPNGPIIVPPPVNPNDPSTASPS